MSIIFKTNDDLVKTPRNQLNKNTSKLRISHASGSVMSLCMRCKKQKKRKIKEMNTLLLAQINLGFWALFVFVVFCLLITVFFFFRNSPLRKKEKQPQENEMACKQFFHGKIFFVVARKAGEPKKISGWGSCISEGLIQFGASVVSVGVLTENQLFETRIFPESIPDNYLSIIVTGLSNGFEVIILRKRPCDSIEISHDKIIFSRQYFDNPDSVLQMCFDIADTLSQNLES